MPHSFHSHSDLSQELGGDPQHTAIISAVISFSGAPAHGGHVGAAGMSVPGAVGISGQAALSAGLAVQLTLVQRQLGHALLGAHKQPLLKGGGWIQEGAERGTVKKKKEGISFNAEDQQRNKTLISLRRPCNSHYWQRGVRGGTCLCVGMRIDAFVFTNHVWWSEHAVDFLSPGAQTILIMHVCVCVVSLHQCSDWGVTIATGDEVVLGDTWWGDEWYVWCCASSCVSAGEFGSLTGSFSHHLPSSLKVSLLSPALGAARHTKRGTLWVYAGRLEYKGAKHRHIQDRYYKYAIKKTSKRLSFKIIDTGTSD